MKATNPDEFTQLNAYHTNRFQCNHEFTGLDVVAHLGKGSFNHSPGPMEVFKTQSDDKSISIYDPSGLCFCSYPRQITMQGIQVPCSSTSTFYPGSKLSELLDNIFAVYLFLCLIDAHGKTSLLGFHLGSGQIELLQIFCQDDLYDYPMFPDPPK